MKQEKIGFARGRIKSLTFAFKGMWLLITSEPSIMVQISISILVCFLGWFLDISALEWILQIFAIGLVLVAESLNTAIEKICDFIQPKDDHKIGWIKDVSAGAVAFAALTSILIGLIIYLPKLSDLI